MELLAPYLPEIIAGLAAVLLAALSFIHTKIVHANSKKRLDALEKSDLKGLFVKCPYCGSYVELSHAEIVKEVNNEQAKNVKEEK